MKTCLGFFFFYCLSALGHVDGQVTITVATNGNDTNSGTRDHPLATIAKALLAADNQTGRQVIIQLRRGTYYLDHPVTINSKPASYTSLQITGYNDEQVYISAGRRLHLQWRPYINGIYQANVPKGIIFERLYIDGRLQVLARYPNYDPAARVFHGTAGDAIAPDRILRWKHPEGGYVHALHAYEWGSFDYRITGVDDSGRLQLSGGWQNNRPAGMHSKYRFVENIFEELDTVNEWWLDRAKSILYYYPPNGFNPDRALVEVSNLRNTIELRGSQAYPVRNIRLSRLNFIHNERSFMETKEPLLRSDWTIYRGGAVLLEGTEHCTIADCSFTDIGGNAIMVSDYNKDDSVTGCLVQHIGASAVCFVGDPKAVRSPSFRYEDYIPYAQLDKTPGPLTNNYPRQCVVSNNLFHDLGEIEKQATGVELDISAMITVSHNSIYNTPRAGLNIGDGCFGGHVLEYNDVFNTVLESGDHGSFNSWGRDRYWSPDRRYMDSLVAAHPELVLLDAQQPIIICHNRFRCDHGWDVDLDDGSSNYKIYDNVCLHGGLKLREGFYRVVENNILVNNTFHPHVWFKGSGDIFRQNIVMRAYAPIGIKAWGDSVDDNLFPDTAALHVAQARGTDGHSQAGNPMFEDPASGNYTVKPNSNALAIGFINFSMDDFGVQKPALKKIAARPVFPVLVTDTLSSGGPAIISFLGGMIKSVEGPGERSAYGLPDESGVIVVAAGTGILAQSGLKDKDVIRMADGNPVRTVPDLQRLYQSTDKPGMSLQIIRDQKPTGPINLPKR